MDDGRIERHRYPGFTNAKSHVIVDIAGYLALLGNILSLTEVHLFLGLGCGGTLSADTDGELASPGWPNNYEMLNNCTWIITTSQSGQSQSIAIADGSINQSIIQSVIYLIVRSFIHSLIDRSMNNAIIL